MKKKITYSFLVDKISEESHQSKSLINQLLRESFAISKERLKKDKRFSLPGLGNFSLKWHQDRNGRNPKSGEPLRIAAHYSVNFKTQAKLQKHINRRYGLLKPIAWVEKPTQATEKTSIHKEREKEEKHIPISKPIESGENSVKQSNSIISDKKELSTIHAKENPNPGNNTASKNSKSNSPFPTMETKESGISQANSKQSFKPILEEKNSSTTAESKQALSGSKTPPTPTPVRTKKSFPWWILILLLLIIPILAYFIWPSAETKTPIKVVANKTEVQTKPSEKKSKSQLAASKPLPPLKKSVPGTASLYYKIKRHDYLFVIARQHYKNSGLWPLIYVANRSNIDNPNTLIYGSEIKLPALDGTPGNLTETDKKKIAKAYLEVYIYYKNKDKKKARTYLWVATQLNPDLIGANSNRISEKDREIVKSIKGNSDF